MNPRVEECREGRGGGVRKAHTIDGRLRDSLLLEIYTDRGVGTEIVLADNAGMGNPKSQIPNSKQIQNANAK